HGLCVQTSSVVLRRQVLDAVGLFDEDQILYEDADLWSRISEQFDWGFLDEPLVLYRPDVDQRPHRLTDERLNLLEAWRYYAKYAARRCRRGADPGEDAGTACFLDGLTAVARAIGEPWPPLPGVLA